MQEVTTDCRSEEGITVGLIDALISIARVLAKRDLRKHKAVREALKDLDNDEDFGAITDAAVDVALMDQIKEQCDEYRPR